MAMRLVKCFGLAAIAAIAGVGISNSASADHYSNRHGHNHGCSPRPGYPSYGYNYGYRPPIQYPIYGYPIYGVGGYTSNYGGYNGNGFSQPSWGGYGMGGFPVGGSYGGGAFPRGGSYGGGSGYSLYLGR